jgi:hypothetical protein
METKDQVWEDVDLLKVYVGNRPTWWMNIVYHYEDNVLGGRDKEYPSRKIYQLQHLEHYGFITDRDSQWAIFPDPSDYISVLLKFGGEFQYYEN